MKPEIKERIERINGGEVPEGYKRTKVGIVPEEWETSIVEECCIVENALRKPISEDQRKLIQGEFPYYGPTRVQDYLNEYAYDGKYVLIGEDGDHFLKYRLWPMTQLVGGKFNVNNHAHVIKGSTKCLTEWFDQFYKHRTLHPYLTRQGANRYKLTKEALLVLSVLLPSLVEQEKIISITQAWDKAIELKEKLIEQKKEQKKGLMQSLLTGKVRLSGFYGEWKPLKLGQVAEKIVGGGTPAKDRPEYYEGDIPWASVKDLSDVNFIDDTIEHITELGLANSSSKIVAKGNFIIATRMGLGRGVINIVEMAINQDLKGIYVKKSMITVRYLMYSTSQ